MNNSRARLFAPLMALALTLAACSSPEPEPTAQRTQIDPSLNVTMMVTQPPPTANATSTTVVVAAPEIVPSATLEPTPTAAPTDTPQPTATPVPQPVLPHKQVPQPSGEGTTGFAPSMSVVSTLSDGVTVTNQVGIPDYLLPVPARAPLIDLPPNTINIGLLGIDTRPKSGGKNTDVIIIASINPDVPAITLLSIPRDTLVWIPGWRSHKINTSFARSPDVFKQTVLYNFGINVDYYAVVNFSAVVNAVNTLDGIDVVATCPLFHIFPKDPYFFSDPANPNIVTRPYVDTFTGEEWVVGQPVPTTTINIPVPGVYTLYGMQALAFSRARYGVPGGDIDRGRREQMVIRAILSKARQIGSFTKIPELYGQFQENVQTDLSLTDILALAGFAANLENDDLIIRSRYIDQGGLSGSLLPVVGSVLIPNRQTMLPYLQQTLNVALNQKPTDGVPVELVNGYGNEGFGAAAAYRLRELGFNVVSITQSEERLAKTQVVDFTTTQKGSAIPLLKRTFNIKDSQIITEPVAGAAPDAPKYRILAGRDFQTCYYNSPSTAQQSQPAAVAQPTAAPVLTDTGVLTDTVPAPDPNAPTPDPALITPVAPEATPPAPAEITPEVTAAPVEQPPVEQTPPVPVETTPDPNAPPPEQPPADGPPDGAATPEG